MTETPVTLPGDELLIVTPEQLATRAGFTLTTAQRATVVDVILDAQADVEAYLGRPVLPTTYVQQDAYAWPDGWHLTMHGDDPIVEVVSAVPVLVDGQPTDYFTVTYIAGIDGRTINPIRRFVRAHAYHSAEFSDLWKKVTKATGEVRTVSAEGQSITYAPATLSGNTRTGEKPGDLTPGSLPTLKSLDRWRVAGRRVHQGPTQASDWPFTGRRW